MDSKCAENIVIYDWLSFTSKVHSVDDLIEVLGLDHCPWMNLPGAPGYKHRKYFGSISVHFDGREDMGVWVEMSGQGCRVFETLSNVGWDKLFAFIRENGLKITRLDVAYDDHTGVLDIGQIVSDTHSGLYSSKSRSWETRLSNKGTSVIIGSPKSEVLIRIYDKAAERGKSDQHWIRVEFQLRRDRAVEFSRIDKPIGEAFAGVLKNYLRYICPSDDSNKWRWPMTDYWQALIGDVSAISIYHEPGMEYNESHLKNFVFRQAGNAIDCAIELLGPDKFYKMLRERNVKPNPKYEKILRDAAIEVYAKIAEYEKKMKEADSEEV